MKSSIKPNEYVPYDERNPKIGEVMKEQTLNKIKAFGESVFYKLKIVANLLSS